MEEKNGRRQDVRRRLHTADRLCSRPKALRGAESASAKDGRGRSSALAAGVENGRQGGLLRAPFALAVSADLVSFRKIAAGAENRRLTTINEF